MLFPALEAEPIVRAARRLIEELDTALEATKQQLFGRSVSRPSVHRVRGDPRAEHRPRPHIAAGGGRAVRGDGDVEQSERDLAAETLVRFVFRSLYRFHAFNGDPHPGNYLFEPAARSRSGHGLVKRFDATSRAPGADGADHGARNPTSTHSRRLEKRGGCRPARRCPTSASPEYSGSTNAFVRDDKVAPSRRYASATARRCMTLQGEFATSCATSTCRPRFVRAPAHQPWALRHSRRSSHSQLAPDRLRSVAHDNRAASTPLGELAHGGCRAARVGSVRVEVMVEFELAAAAPRRTARAPPSRAGMGRERQRAGRSPQEDVE